MSDVKLKFSQLPAVTGLSDNDRVIVNVPIGNGQFRNKIILVSDLKVALGISGGTSFDDLISFTGLTGGGAALDGITVTNVAGPTFVMGYDATFGVGTFRKKVGTEATDLPSFVRPTSYTGSSPNNVVWEKV